MANILEDAIKSASESFVARPEQVINEVMSSTGMRQKILQGAGAFGGAIGAFTGAITEPRKTYNFGISITMPGGGGKAIEANVKSVTRPKVNMDFRSVRYYNTVRRQLNAVHFDPITIVIYDDLAGTVQRDMEKLLSSKLTDSAKSKFTLGSSIDVASFSQSIIDEIIIHSSASPVTSLISGGFKAASKLLKTSSISSAISGALSGAGTQNMKLKYCTVERIDFGEFNYAESAANLIIMTVSYQSLEFGASTVQNKALETLGGVAARVLTGGL